MARPGGKSVETKKVVSFLINLNDFVLKVKFFRVVICSH